MKTLEWHFYVFYSFMLSHIVDTWHIFSCVLVVFLWVSSLLFFFVVISDVVGVVFLRCLTFNPFPAATVFDDRRTLATRRCCTWLRAGRRLERSTILQRYHTSEKSFIYF